MPRIRPARPKRQIANRTTGFATLVEFEQVGSPHEVIGAGSNRTDASANLASCRRWAAPIQYPHANNRNRPPARRGLDRRFRPIAPACPTHAGRSRIAYPLLPPHKLGHRVAAERLRASSVNGPPVGLSALATGRDMRV